MKDGSASGRLVELDALRGLAALGVVAFHYTTFYQQQIGHRPPLPFGFAIGNYGVHLFFLISGFVIFMTLERTRGAMDFVVSRFSRLFPAYWAAIALTAAVVYTVGLPQQRLGLRDLALNATMLQQFLGGEHLDGSYWTLQVELFFYLQMLAWWMLGALRHVRWIVLGWLALALAYGESAQHQLHFSWALRELLIVRHIPFFALGIVFYRIHRDGARLPDLALLPCCLGVIAFEHGSTLLLVGLACCLVFMAFVRGWLRPLRAGPFVFLGTISYSLYLLHQAIGLALIHRMEAAGVPSPAAVAAAVAACVALATAVALGVERPAMQAIRTAWGRRHRRPLLAGA